MNKLWLFLLLGIFVFLTACTNLASQSKFCKTDDDCVCGGIDKATQNCFVGNKQYYDSGAVDKSKVCPDFCTGIAANLVTKCVESKCMNVNKNTFPECSADADCVPVSGCHPSSCVPKLERKNDGPFICTQNCAPGTLDCGGSCACESKRCVAKNLYQEKDSVPVV